MDEVVITSEEDWEIVLVTAALAMPAFVDILLDEIIGHSHGNSWIRS